MEPIDIQGHLFEEEGLWLAEMARGGTAIEIGSYRGRSTCFIARAAAHVIACDPFTGQPHPRAEQHVVDFAEVRRAFHTNVAACGVARKVELLACTSRMAYESLSKRAPIVDLIFVDGSHHGPDIAHD